MVRGAGIVQCKGVVLCINDRVGLPRPLRVPGQEHFLGVVADGTSDSLAGRSCGHVGTFGFFSILELYSFYLPKQVPNGSGIDWHGKRVVIAGMGAFAVENVYGAQSPFLCREMGTPHELS